MDNLGTLRCISRVACTQSVKLPVRFVISALVFLLIYITEPTVAVEFKCSACEAVASELQSRLNKEVPRNHLDMRHRLDGNGNRYGKMIPYKESELRVHDLLVCSRATS
uniref:Protein canopy 1-like n=1 Tax=Tetraselmis sp. GSL018 TaxID=582737 RepID=A0A061RDE6_9CHLO